MKYTLYINMKRRTEFGNENYYSGFEFNNLNDAMKSFRDYKESHAMGDSFEDKMNYDDEARNWEYAELSLRDSEDSEIIYYENHFSKVFAYKKTEFGYENLRAIRICGDEEEDYSDDEEYAGDEE